MCIYVDICLDRYMCAYATVYSNLRKETIRYIGGGVTSSGNISLASSSTRWLTIKMSR